MDVLKEVEAIGTGNIGRLRSCTPCFPDDITCLSTTPYGLQKMIDIVYTILMQMEISIQPRKTVKLNFKIDEKENNIKAHSYAKRFVCYSILSSIFWT